MKKLLQVQKKDKDTERAFKYTEFKAKYLDQQLKKYNDEQEMREALLGRKEFNEGVYDCEKKCKEEKVLEEEK